MCLTPPDHAPCARPNHQHFSNTHSPVRYPTLALSTTYTVCNHRPILALPISDPDDLVFLSYSTGIYRFSQILARKRVRSMRAARRLLALTLELAAPLVTQTRSHGRCRWCERREIRSILQASCRCAVVCPSCACFFFFCWARVMLY